ncbi:MAG: hypothetical protein ACRDNJ_03390, partial [Solirubrobacteraceae bacterium]
MSIAVSAPAPSARTARSAASAPPAAERWRPRGLDVASRLRSWSEILAETHLAFDVRPTPRTP